MTSAGNNKSIDRARARQWRPVRFGEVAGQQRVLAPPVNPVEPGSLGALGESISR